MNLNWIEARNVLSFEKVYVNLDNLGNLIKIDGINEDFTPARSNGAGKSGVIEIISLLIRGTTLRKSTKKEVKNSLSKGKPFLKGCVNDNIIIERTISPASLNVTVDGVAHNGESVAETQEMLYDLLNTNSKVFAASMVFGQENSLKFLTSNAEDKRIILQSFLNASDLFKDRHSIKAMKSDYNNEKKVSQTLMGNAVKSLNINNLEIEKLNGFKRESLGILKGEKSKFIEKYSISDIQEMERANHEADLDIRSGNLELDRKINTLETCKGKVRVLGKGSCDKCGELSNLLTTELENLKNQIKELEESIPRLRVVLKKKVKALDLVTIPITSQDLETVENVKNFESQIKFYKERRKELNEEIADHSEDILEQEKMYALLRFWEMAFSEKGLVRYIIRNILDYLNDSVNTYLGVITKGVFSLEFNDTLEETILSDGRLASYDTLSGGEKKSIDLSVMLALNDLLLLSGKDRSNVIFFDEVAESLDDDGVVGLFNLMESQSKGKKIFIITHNELLSSLLVDKAEVIEVTKKLGISTIKVIN